MAIKVNFSCTYTFFFVLRWHLPQAGPTSKLQLKNAAHTSRQNRLATMNSLCSLGLPSFFLFPQSHVLCGNPILLEIFAKSVTPFALSFCLHNYEQVPIVQRKATADR